MALVCILVSVISACYYLKIVKLLHIEDKDGHVLENENKDLINIVEYQNQSSVNTNNLIPSLTKDTSIISPSLDITNLHSFIISFLTLSILLFVLKPSIILNSTQLLSLSIYNF